MILFVERGNFYYRMLLRCTSIVIRVIWVGNLVKVELTGKPFMFTKYVDNDLYDFNYKDLYLSKWKVKSDTCD